VAPLVMSSVGKALRIFSRVQTCRKNVVAKHKRRMSMLDEAREAMLDNQVKFQMHTQGLSELYDGNVDMYSDAVQLHREHIREHPQIVATLEVVTSQIHRPCLPY
jgi:hypothetical protein